MIILFNCRFVPLTIATRGVKMASMNGHINNDMNGFMNGVNEQTHYNGVIKDMKHGLPNGKFFYIGFVSIIDIF